MYFSTEQLQTIYAALEQSSVSLSEEFNKFRHSQNVEEIQHAVDIYRRWRSTNRLLARVRIGAPPLSTPSRTPSMTTVKTNNVISLIEFKRNQDCN